MTKNLAFQLAGLSRNKKQLSALTRQASEMRIRSRSASGRSTRTDESWTPATPVNPDDPRFARNNLSALMMLAQGIERKVG